MKKPDEVVKEKKQILPVNNPDKTYMFSISKYVQDRRECGIREEEITHHVKTWAHKYDGKIAKGNTVYDDDGIGIPAFSEWCQEVKPKTKSPKKRGKKK